MDLEVEYDNRARVPGHPAIVEGWKTDAEAYRKEVAKRASFDLAYGAGPRNRLDVFPAENPKESRLCVFIHGGYWRTFDKSVFSHMARGANAHGIDVALPSYSLCPEVTVPEIVDELRQACLYLWHSHKRPLIVVGHSAGGQLAAAMAATGWQAYGAPADLVRAGFGISGLYDLRPLIATTVNDTAKLTEAQAVIASPLLWPAPKSIRFDVWVGAIESSEYLRQSLSLVAAWKGVGLDARYKAVQGEDHFSVIGPLADPGSALTRNLVELCGL